LYSPIHIFKTFDVLNIWFRRIRKRGENLPATLDYNLFFGGILKILQVEESISLEKILWFLFFHLGFFPIDIRLELWDFLFCG
jgi:hypothetical protein